MALPTYSADELLNVLSSFVGLPATNELKDKIRNTLKLYFEQNYSTEVGNIVSDCLALECKNRLPDYVHKRAMEIREGRVTVRPTVLQQLNRPKAPLNRPKAPWKISTK